MWGHQVPCEKSREEWVRLGEGCMGEPVSFTSSGLCFQDKYVWYLTGLPASPLLDLNTKSFKDLTAFYLLVGFSKNDSYPAVTCWWDDFGVSSWYLLIFLQVFYDQVLFNPFRMYFKNKIKMQYFAGSSQPSILHYAQVRILQSTGVLHSSYRFCPRAAFFIHTYRKQEWKVCSIFHVDLVFILFWPWLQA